MLNSCSKQELLQMIKLSTDRINKGLAFEYDVADRLQALEVYEKRFGENLASKYPIGGDDDEQHFVIKSDITKMVKKDLGDNSKWLLYKYYKIHLKTGIIYRDGHIVKNKIICGVSKAEFIMQALENYKNEICVEVPSYGFGKVEHVHNKYKFKNNLGDLLYDSPYNLKRAPEEGGILYMGVYNNHIIVKIFSNARNISDYFGTSPEYVRQCLRGVYKTFKGGTLEIVPEEDILRYFSGLAKYGDIDEMVDMNLEEMEDMGWI